MTFPKTISVKIVESVSFELKQQKIQVNLISHLRELSLMRLIDNTTKGTVNTSETNYSTKVPKSCKPLHLNSND